MFYVRKISNNKGFTLIELLVVIAIIGLLSSIILTTLSSARIKAENSARNQTVHEYINALNLIITDKGTFPDPGAGIWCLGDYPLNTCIYYSTTEVESITLHNLFSVYLPTLPKLKPIKTDSGILTDSPFYTCGPGCTEGRFIWFLQGMGQACLPDYNPVSWDGITLCW